MRIIVLGPQGSGKSIQADLLAKHFKVPHIDVGQLLRDHIARKTAIGKKIKKVMKKGELLPSDIVNTLVKKRLAQPDCNKGFIFDGYPRELVEAEFLDDNAHIDLVISLDIPDDLAIKRISERMLCIGCTVPLYGLPEKIGKDCKACGGKLEQREDDKPEAVKKRLRIYHDVTEPLIEYFRPRDIVHNIDGTGTVEVVNKRIMKSIE